MKTTVVLVTAMPTACRDLHSAQGGGSFAFKELSPNPMGIRHPTSQGESPTAAAKEQHKRCPKAAYEEVPSEGMWRTGSTLELSRGEHRVDQRGQKSRGSSKGRSRAARDPGAKQKAPRMVFFPASASQITDLGLKASFLSGCQNGPRG